MLVFKGDEEIKKPLGKNVKLYYDTFFKSVQIQFTGSDALTEQNNKAIKLEYTNSKDGITFYVSGEGEKFWSMNADGTPVNNGTASFNSSGQETKFTIKVTNLERY